MEQNLNEGNETLSALQAIERRIDEISEGFSNTKGENLLKKMKNLAREKIKQVRSHLEENRSIESIQNDTIKLRSWVSKLEKLRKEEIEKGLQEIEAEVSATEETIEQEEKKDTFQSEGRQQATSLPATDQWIGQRDLYESLVEQIETAKKKGKQRISVAEYPPTFLRTFIDAYMEEKVKLSPDHNHLWID